MDRIKRIGFQAIVWLIFMFLIWMVQDFRPRLLWVNSTAYGIVLISIIISTFYSVPKLLVAKKYIAYTIISLLLIFLNGYILHALVDVISKPPRPDMNLPHVTGNSRPPGPIGPGRGIPHILINYIFIGTSVVLSSLIEMFVFARKKEKEIIKSKNEKLQTELKLLKSQINPHFLFNSLNNIYTLSVINSDKTQQSISYLSDMLRYVLYECNQDTVPLQKEMKYIEDYIKLFSLKSSKPYPIETHFNVSGTGMMLPPMLLIPFVENALKHSNIGKADDSFVMIRIDANEKEIQFKVENSLPEKAISKDAAGGIGLENVKKRLAILYPENHQLIIREDTEAFKINLIIKLHGNPKMYRH